jgi:DNA-directed RNA polymerase subunit RPC12/RpoP
MIQQSSAWDHDIQQLQGLIDHINGTGEIPDFGSLWFVNWPSPQQGELQLDIGHGRPVWLPLEAARILRKLRQRFEPKDKGRALIWRMRVEAAPRRRPVADRVADDLPDRLGAVARIGGHKKYSEFQIRGWEAVLNALERPSHGVVLVAPTGGGKTEAFMLPLLYWIREGLSQSGPPRFAVLYPRKALLHDQISRAFRYVVQADPQGRIIVGLQFEGIRESINDTLADPNLFYQRSFQLLEQCPWCGQEVRLQFESPPSSLRCPKCQRRVLVSISKEQHRRLQPHLLLSTAESLDRMYLDPSFHEYLAGLHGIVLDEAHLFHGLYGAHIHHLIRRLTGLRPSGRLFRAASSATILHPEAFGQALLGLPVEVVNAADFQLETAGVEIFFFLQANQRSIGGKIQEQTLSAMIQAAMAFGHGILREGERLLIFADSRDIAGRLARDLKDAEERKLWSFRILHEDQELFQFQGARCPREKPAACNRLYLEGECWRGILGGARCHERVQELRERPMDVQVITGGTPGRRTFEGDVVIGTSAIEVGIDDPNARATLHYRPPRTVFEFIQRRGRAGRRGGIAWTAVVLGQKPSDHFYLLRRRRLIEGRYRLPLNPDNPVIEKVHSLLGKAREELQGLGHARRAEERIWAWIIRRLRECRHVMGRHPQVGEWSPDAPAWERLSRWIRKGQEDAAREMGAEWELPRLRGRLVSDSARDIFDDIYSAFRKWLDEEIDDAELDRVIEEGVRKMQDYLPGVIFRGQPPEDLQNIILAAQFINSFREQGREKARQAVRSGRAWYDFFVQLERLLDPPWARHIPADAIRAVLQALFLLHEGLEEECPAHPGAYVPDAFFEEVRPIRVEVLFRKHEEEREGQERKAQTYLEPADRIFHILAPYSLIYRYGVHGLFALAADPIRLIRGGSEKEGPVLPRLRLRPLAEGPLLRHPRDPQRTVRRVRRVSVREIRCDANGQVGLCLKCLRLHDVDASGPCSCGDAGIRKGRIYLQETYEEAGFTEASPSPIGIGRSFERLERLQVWGLLRGSLVRFVPSSEDEPELRFFAWLEPPFYYDFQTRGVRWRLGEILRGVSDLSDRAGEALHAAAHVLLKAMAAVVGVREDQLMYAVDEPNQAVLVWERAEGGAGLSEVFAETLQEDPLAVYREMVAAVACPIYLAEEESAQSSSPSDSEALIRRTLERLSQEFQLPPDDPVLQEIARETAAVAAEIRRSGSEGETCRESDGCPACIHAVACTQDRHPSRSLAARLVASLARRIPASEWGREGIPGPVIWADEAKGEYVVLVL